MVRETPRAAIRNRKQGVSSAARRVGDPSSTEEGGAHDPDLFTGLFRFTVRLFRANAGLLVAVGLAATAAALLAAALLEGVHS